MKNHPQIRRKNHLYKIHNKEDYTKMLNSKIPAEVKIWDESFVIPFYTRYFLNDPTNQLSLSGNCLYDNENYKADEFAESLIEKFKIEDILTYTKYLLDNDPQRNDSSPGQWPTVSSEKPFPRYYVILAVFLILNFHARSINIHILKDAVWGNIISAKQDYWPELLYPYISCVYNTSEELFIDTINLLYSKDEYSNNLAYSIFYGSSDFPNIPTSVKKNKILSVDTNQLTPYSNKVFHKIKNEFGYSFISNLRHKIGDLF